MIWAWQALQAWHQICMGVVALASQPPSARAEAGLALLDVRSILQHELPSAATIALLACI